MEIIKKFNSQIFTAKLELSIIDWYLLILAIIVSCVKNIFTEKLLLSLPKRTMKIPIFSCVSVYNVNVYGKRKTIYFKEYIILTALTLDKTDELDIILNVGLR